MLDARSLCSSWASCSSYCEYACTFEPWMKAKITTTPTYVGRIFASDVNKAFTRSLFRCFFLAYIPSYFFFSFPLPFFLFLLFPSSRTGPSNPAKGFVGLRAVISPPPAEENDICRHQTRSMSSKYAKKAFGRKRILVYLEPCRETVCCGRCLISVKWNLKNWSKCRCFWMCTVVYQILRDYFCHCSFLGERGWINT